MKEFIVDRLIREMQDGFRDAIVQVLEEIEEEIEKIKKEIKAMSKKTIYPGHYIQNGEKNWKVISKDKEMNYIEYGIQSIGIFEDEATIATDLQGKVLVQAGSEAWWQELIIWLGANLPTLIELFKSLLLIFAKKQGEPNWYARLIIGKKNIERFEQTVHVVR